MSVLEFIISILPVILIGWYIYHKDSEKESSKLLSLLFCLGILSCIPAALIGAIFSSLLPEMENMNIMQLLFYSFIIVALVEEFCKWFFVYKISYHHEEFNTVYDMLVYAAYVALGFACYENILYVTEGGLFVGLLRAISAVPGHVCDGIMMGSYLGLAKLSEVKGDMKNSKKYKILSIIVPTITHGIYDFCVFQGSVLFITIFVIFVIVFFIICIKKIKNVSFSNVRFKFRNKFCTNCGVPVNSNFCPGCGKKHE